MENKFEEKYKLKNSTPIKGGLLETPKEKRLYSFGATFGYLKPELLPNEFTLGNPLEVKNQGTLFTCVANAFAGLMEFQEGVIMSVAYLIKLISEIEGEEWIYKGVSLGILNKIVKKGCLERTEAPYSVEKDGVGIVASPDKWNASYDDMALKHAGKAIFWIGEHGDIFNSIRSAIYQFAKEKRAVQAGIMWQNSWTNETYIDQEDTQSGGHSFYIIGWKGDYLQFVNSIGEEVGEKGIQYLHKSLVNKLMNYGACMRIDSDLTQEQIKQKSKYYRANFMGKLLLLIKNYFNDIFKIL